MNDEEMSWDAWLWVLGLAGVAVGLGICSFALLGIVLGVEA
ncbi:hypothetical protein [Arthrobacter sp. S41]|nr:hypothetical protein [Arthrobacter sp. S41]